MLRRTLVLALCLAAGACAAPSGESPAGSTVAAAPAKAATCQPAPTKLVSRDLEPGSGDPVGPRWALLVNYTGWIYDGCAKDLKGAQFDTSIGRETPFGFMLGAGRVVKGWDEGLVGMRDGGKRLLVVPPDMAYGDKATPDGKIPANSTLVFEVTLVKIVYRPPDQPAAAPAK